MLVPGPARSCLRLGLCKPIWDRKSNLDWATCEQEKITHLRRSSINMISEHHYQTNTDQTAGPSSAWPLIASQLTNKAYIRGNLSSFVPSVVDARKAGIPFVLGETNTFFGHGQPGVSDAAAAALWFIDYSLQAASIGVSGLYFHQGIGYNYSGEYISAGNLCRVKALTRCRSL